MTIPEPFDLLMEALRKKGIEPEPLPPETVGRRLKPETWLAESTDELTSRATRELPSVITGARIDGTPVLLCALTGDPTHEGARATLRRVRNQATIARSWLGTEAADLQMFLVRHPSASRDPLWEEFATLVESDDRVCRKLVWLPTTDGTGESAEAFLARTFLASPWSDAAQPRVAVLDVMSDIALPRGWSAVLEDEGLDAESLLVRLAEAPAE
jgi:hypothetical protein